MLVVYQGRDEVLVTTPDSEAALVREYFTEGGRDRDDYEREVTRGVLELTSSIRVGMD